MTHRTAKRDPCLRQAGFATLASQITQGAQDDGRTVKLGESYRGADVDDVEASAA